MEELVEQVEQNPQLDVDRTLFEIIFDAFVAQEDEKDDIVVVDYKKVEDFATMLKGYNTLKKIDSIPNISQEFSDIFVMISQNFNMSGIFRRLSQIFVNNMKSNTEFDYFEESINEYNQRQSTV